MLKLLSRLIASSLVVVTLVAVPVAASASVTPGNLSCELTGAGTALSPYLIDSRSALQEIGDCADISTVTHYKQTDMIDLGASVWTPLVDQDPASSSGLKIAYDGDNWAITRMKAEGLWMGSLFGHLGAGSAVSNLLLHGQSVGYVKTAPASGPFIPAKHLAGAVAGLATGGVSIENVQVVGFGRISGATAGSLIGVLDGGTSTLNNNMFESIWYGLGTWGIDRGSLSAMSSFHSQFNGGTPISSTADISVVGGMVGAVVGATSAVTMDSNIVSSWIGVAGIDSVSKTLGRQSPARVGGLVGYLEAGSLSISNASISGNITGSDVDPSSTLSEEYATAGIVGFVSHADLSPISLQISEARTSVSIRGWGYQAGIVGNYRTDTSNPKSIVIEKVFASGSMAASTNRPGRKAAGVIFNVTANANTDINVSDVVLLINMSDADATGVQVAGAVAQSSPATVSNLYFDPSISQAASAAAFVADSGLALPSNWSTQTAPVPFSQDGDAIQLSSVASMGTWTTEDFAVCSGSAQSNPTSGVSSPGMALSRAAGTIQDYGITMPALESGVCIEDAFSISYPSSTVTVSPTRSVRENVVSGVFAPTTDGKGLIYRVSGGSVPAGLLLNPATGALIGRPTAALQQDVAITILAGSGDLSETNPVPNNRTTTTQITLSAASSQPPAPVVTPVLNAASGDDHVVLDHSENRVFSEVELDVNQDSFDLATSYSLTQTKFFACTAPISTAAVFELSGLNMSGADVRDLSISSPSNACKAFPTANTSILEDIDLKTMISGEAFTSLQSSPAYKYITLGRVVDSNSNASFQAQDHVVLARSTEYRPVSDTSAPGVISQPTVTLNGSSVSLHLFQTQYFDTTTQLWVCDSPVTKIDTLTGSAAELVPAGCDPLARTSSSHGVFVMGPDVTLNPSSYFTKVDGVGAFVPLDTSNPLHNRHLVAAGLVISGTAPGVFYRVLSDSVLLPIVSSGASIGSSNPFEGPVVTRISRTLVDACSPGIVVVSGRNLDGATLTLQGKVAKVLESSSQELVVQLPEGLVAENGVDLEIQSQAGFVLVQDALSVRATSCVLATTFASWTKISLDGKSVRVLSKAPIGVGKVQFFVNGKEIAWIRAADATDPKLSFASEAAYFVRTVNLSPGKNRFEITANGERVWRATYVPRD